MKKFRLLVVGLKIIIIKYMRAGPGQEVKLFNKIDKLLFVLLYFHFPSYNNDQGRRLRIAKIKITIIYDPESLPFDALYIYLILNRGSFKQKSYNVNGTTLDEEDTFSTSC